MNDWYFFQDQGQTVGPVGLAEIKSRIQDGRLRVFDLIFHDGDKEWKMALDHTHLRAEFQVSTAATLKDRPWICLQRKGGEELNFVTTGPFTADEIRQAIQGGELSYSDYAWKESFADWKRIGALEEFNSRLNPKPERQNSAPPREVPAETLLSNVVELRRPKLPLPELRPPESSGPDLTQVSKSAKSPVATPPRGRVERVNPVAGPPPLPTTPSAHETQRRSLPFVDWGLVGVLALVVVAMVLLVSRFVLHRPVKPMSADWAPPVETSAPVNPPPVAPPPTPEVDTDKVVDVELEENVTPATKPSKSPTELILNVHSLSANSSRIEIRSDGGPDFPVFVQIVGVPGQIAEGGLFYRFTRYQPTGDPAQPLDLSGLRLPQGKYILRAETGSLKREARLNMGLNDPSFKSAVNRQRKMWAHALWKERLALFRLSQALEKQLAQGLVPTKKFSIKGLEPLMEVKRSNGAQYYLFEDWWELRQIVNEAKGTVTPGLVARAQKERDHLASFSVWK